MIQTTDDQPMTWNWTGPKFKILVAVITWVLIAIIIGSIQMVAWILDGLGWIITQIT